MNPMHQPLPRFTTWETKPAPGEPGHGYFARLVRDEAHTSARVYANEIEINGRHVVLKEILDELLKIPLDERYRESLVTWTPVWTGRRHMLAGESFRRRQISFLSRRFCRGCLAEAPHHRAWWDIVHFQVCPLHSTPLEALTKEGNSIGWWWPSFEMAPDGEHLPLRVPRNEEPDGFEHYLLHRLGYLAGNPRLLLDGTPIHEVIDVCEMVGRLVSNPWSSRAPAQNPKACRAGFELMRGGLDELEADFVKWLEGNVPEKIRNTGLNNGFGWLRWNEQSNCGHSSIWHPVGLAMRRALARTGRVGRQHKGAGDLPIAKARSGRLRRKSGSTLKDCGGSVSNSGLHGREGRAFLTDDKVSALQGVVEDLVPAKTARELLGCSLDLVRGLGDLGALKAFLGTGLYGNESHGLAFRRSDVEGLRERIDSIHLTGSEGLTHGLAYLAKATKRKSATIVLDVIDGKMSVSRLDARRTGISAWRFEAVANKLPYRRQARDQDVRAVEAAAMTGFQIDVIASFVDAGIIKAHGSGRRMFLEKRSFLKFHERFVNAKLYLEQLGCDDYHLGRRLLELKVRCHFPHIRTRNAVYVVERQRLEAALGLVASNKDDPDVWAVLREKMATACPSYVVPSESEGKVVKAYLSTRVTFVELEVVGNEVAVRKTFRQAAPREWKVFVANEQRIREELGVFSWSKLAGGGGWSAELIVGSSQGAAAAAAALAAFHRLFKDRKLLPVGRENKKVTQ